MGGLGFWEALTGGSPTSPLPHPLFGEFRARHADKVFGLDGKDQQGFTVRVGLLGLGQVRLKVFLRDFDPIDLVDHRGILTLGNRDAEQLPALVRLDDEGEHRPSLTLGEGLNLATLLILNRLLNSGEVGEVHPRAEDASGHLFEGRALELRLGGGVGLVVQLDELTLAGLASLHEGGGVGGEDSGGDAVGGEPHWSDFHV